MEERGEAELKKNKDDIALLSLNAGLHQWRAPLELKARLESYQRGDQKMEKHATKAASNDDIFIVGKERIDRATFEQSTALPKEKK